MMLSETDDIEAEMLELPLDQNALQAASHKAASLFASTISRSNTSSTFSKAQAGPEPSGRVLGISRSTLWEKVKRYGL